MRKTLFVVGALLAAAGVGSMSARAQQVTKQDVDGVKNFKRLETTVACAGATKADAVPEIKKMRIPPWPRNFSMRSRPAVAIRLSSIVPAGIVRLQCGSLSAWRLTIGMSIAPRRKPPNSE